MQGLKNKVEEILRISAVEKVDILCLQETWLGGESNRNVRLKGFKLLTCNRTGGYGGSAIAIRRHYKIKKIDVQDINNEHVQAVACQVEQLRMLIISVYVKPNTPKEMLRSWFRKARERMTKTNSLIKILAGDFNAYHGAWGNPYEDAKGRILLEKCEVGDLLVLQNGEHTHVSHNGTKTAIDLTIIPINMAHRVQRSVTERYIGASSHKMIIITIDN